MLSQMSEKPTTQPSGREIVISHKWLLDHFIELQPSAESAMRGVAMIDENAGFQLVSRNSTTHSIGPHRLGGPLSPNDSPNRPNTLSAGGRSDCLPHA